MASVARSITEGLGRYAPSSYESSARWIDFKLEACASRNEPFSVAISRSYSIIFWINAGGLEVPSEDASTLSLISSFPSKDWPGTWSRKYSFSAFVVHNSSEAAYNSRLICRNEVRRLSISVPASIRLFFMFEPVLLIGDECPWRVPLESPSLAKHSNCSFVNAPANNSSFALPSSETLLLTRNNSDASTFTCSRSSDTTLEPASTFTTALFWIFFALLAYRRQFKLSSKLDDDGETHAIMSVLWFPPKLPFKRRVSLESRYGTKVFPRFFGSPRADITLPSTNKPLLISIPSLRRLPSAFVRFCLSEPAKSTKLNFDLFTSTSIGGSSDSPVLSWLWMIVVVCSTTTLIIAWLRELSLFIAVAPVTRRSIPRDKHSSASSAEFTFVSVAPTTSGSTVGPPSRITRRAESPPSTNKSRTSSPYNSKNWTRTSKSYDSSAASFFRSCRWRNNSRNALGMTPEFEALPLEEGPNMVYVFPLPVCPYARVVAL